MSTKWEKVKEEVLLKCKRYCCFCGKFKGTHIEVHHIRPRSKGGEDTVDNAIPVCFDCHAEIGAHSYNTEHPKGNRYSEGELKRIRDNFYEKVQNLPYRPSELSDNDKSLLEDFKSDFTELMEYIVRRDISCEWIPLSLPDEIAGLIDKWERKKRIFQDERSESVKQNILRALSEYSYYLGPNYLHLMDNALGGRLLYNNRSPEEGMRLREELRPESLRLRVLIGQELEELYDIGR